MVEATDGTFVVLTGGLTGTASKNPAFEINDRNGLRVDGTLIVRMWPGFLNPDVNIGQEYIFDGGLNNEPVNLQTVASYAILDSDCGKLISRTNAGAMTDTIAEAGAAGKFLDDWWVDIEDRGNGSWTLTPTTSTIDGLPSLTLTKDQGCRLISKGGQFYTAGRGIQPAYIKITTAAAAGGLFDATLQVQNPTTLAWTTLEAVYAVDANGATTLTVGDRYMGRFDGVNGGRQLYQINTASGPTNIFNSFVLNETAPPASPAVGQFFLGTDCNFYFWCGPCDWEELLHTKSAVTLKVATSYYWPLSEGPPGPWAETVNDGVAFILSNGSGIPLTATSGPNGGSAVHWSEFSGTNGVDAYGGAGSTWILQTEGAVSLPGSTNCVSLWVRLDALPDVFVTDVSFFGTKMIGYNAVTGQFFYSADNGVTKNHYTLSSPGIGTWYNIIIQEVDASNLNFYVNGVVQAFATSANLTMSGGLTLGETVGLNGPGFSLCKLGLFSSLSDCDIDDIYNGGKPRDFPYITPLPVTSGGTGSITGLIGAGPDLVGSTGPSPGMSMVGGTLDNPTVNGINDGVTRDGYRFGNIKDGDLLTRSGSTVEGTSTIDCGTTP